MAKMEARSFSSPDEVRQFERGKLELVKIGGATVGLVPSCIVVDTYS